MKSYTPLKMIHAGRYRRCFDTLMPSVQQDVLQRMERLTNEERQWCDDGNYGHLCNILPTLAIDEALAATGMPADKRLQFLSEKCGRH